MSSLSLDLDELNTLVQQGNLKIVDITKNPNNGMDEDELDESVIVSKPSEDLDLTYEEMDGNKINQNNENSNRTSIRLIVLKSKENYYSKAPDDWVSEQKK